MQPWLFIALTALVFCAVDAEESSPEKVRVILQLADSVTGKDVSVDEAQVSLHLHRVDKDGWYKGGPSETRWDYSENKQRILSELVPGERYLFDMVDGKWQWRSGHIFVVPAQPAAVSVVISIPTSQATRVMGKVIDQATGKTWGAAYPREILQWVAEDPQSTDRETYNAVIDEQGAYAAWGPYLPGRYVMTVVSSTSNLTPVKPVRRIVTLPQDASQDLALRYLRKVAVRIADEARQPVTDLRVRFAPVWTPAEIERIRQEIQREAEEDRKGRRERGWPVDDEPEAPIEIQPIGWEDRQTIHPATPGREAVVEDRYNLPIGDEDGYYFHNGVWQIEISLPEVQRTGLALVGNGQVQIGERDTEVKIAVRPAPKLTLRITDPTGKPISGVGLMLHPRPPVVGTPAEIQSGPDGAVTTSIPPGSYTIQSEALSGISPAFIVVPWQSPQPITVSGHLKSGVIRASTTATDNAEAKPEVAHEAPRAEAQPDPPKATAGTVTGAFTTNGKPMALEPGWWVSVVPKHSSITEFASWVVNADGSFVTSTPIERLPLQKDVVLLLRTEAKGTHVGWAIPFRAEAPKDWATIRCDLNSVSPITLRPVALPPGRQGDIEAMAHASLVVVDLTTRMPVAELAKATDSNRAGSWPTRELMVMAPLGRYAIVWMAMTAVEGEDFESQVRAAETAGGLPPAFEFRGVLVSELIVPSPSPLILALPSTTLEPLRAILDRLASP